MSKTIQESIDGLHEALTEYIEATYHVSNSVLIEQRKRLLERPEIISQEPYIESTPRYQPGEQFSAIHGLPQAALEVFTALSSTQGLHEKLLYDPPYKHQSEAIRQTLVEGKNLLVMTGTGSGKTESFLLPILGKLAREAHSNPKAFLDQPAMRALILYPMNALVNDQLGRLRAIFGDPRTATLFKKWAQRPARFARYTSRTPYAGVRSRDKDQRKLHAFGEFYVEIERMANSPVSDEQKEAVDLLDELRRRGKWPAKPNLVTWYGDKGQEWQERKTGHFKRAVTLPDDVELITRSEIQTAPPDLLVTNYSMLEYMLMRPIERMIFDRTRSWLESNPAEKFMVVLDEAHLYRGAAGAEVGLLLRRLRDRLNIPQERFQVICATASFKDAEYAPHFGSQLSGVMSETFVAIRGEYDFRPHQGVGSRRDAEILAALDLDLFNRTETDASRASLIEPLLEHLKTTPTGHLEADLYRALEKFPPLGLLINTTMTQARAVGELGKALFPDSPIQADAAVTALMHLGSMARIDPKAPGLLPCRIHNFFRGLPGLWACMDPNCVELLADEHSGICGKLYSQPRERCDCGARVHEFFTCRYCGTAYARAYTDDIDAPTALWSEPGRRLRIGSEETSALLPIDMLLEEPAPDRQVELAEYDLETGRLNPKNNSGARRRVFLRHDRVTPPTDEEDGEIDESLEARGQFIPCACCNKTQRGRTTVQDHQTKGDEPFQALVARQIQIQPPNAVKATRFAPLRGRKVLVFSDSRQVAARLAPNLQMYSTRDSLRPLIARGFTDLQKSGALSSLISLNDIFLAVLLASKRLGVRLRPELGSGENFAAEDDVEEALACGAADTDTGLLSLMVKMRATFPPRALLEDIVSTVQNPFLGLEPLALASLCERAELTPKLEKLPAIPGLAETTESKIALARAWLRCWRNNGFWLAGMPTTWRNRSRAEGVSVKDKKGKGIFKSMNVIIVDKAARKIFADRWTPDLLAIFSVDQGGAYQLQGGALSLQFEGSWLRCSICKSVYRPIPGVLHCLDCGSSQIAALNPDVDPVFLARKGYYRRPVMAALAEPPREPMALIAAEHTAQLNAPQNEDVFSKAEENELLFQDVRPVMGRRALKASAIDVLSSTTTMEVGIDIGALSGVALRNMPPGRANYQQRAGRAGRRGNAVATVVAFGSADSHDEHYFTKPREIIRGDVIDPKLTLQNREITRRHIRAFLLQRYHQDRLPDVDPAQYKSLFSVLGEVSDFRDRTAILNFHDFQRWLAESEKSLRDRVASWMPSQLSGQDRELLLAEMKDDCIAEVAKAIAPTAGEEQPEEDGDKDEDSENAPEEGDEQPGKKADKSELLQRLLYKGILPRYAFPTDVATFHVFDIGRSSRFRPIMRFAPSQGLPIALSQYAPGKQVWISGKCYTSGAIYSIFSEERFEAWQKKKLYCDCNVCGYARTYEITTDHVNKGDVLDCPACGAQESFGEAKYWLRPTGFAHPVDIEEVTSPDDMPETSYATRAKLTMRAPAEDNKWKSVNGRVRILSDRPHLLVSNTGPKSEGYTYCTKCGRIEASSEPSTLLSVPHPKPFPDEKEPTCDGGATSPHIVLGTDFITDIALLSVDVAAPMHLKPGHYPTNVALRTVSEAIAKAGSRMLEIEPGELMAEYRPSLTPEGREGLKAEIFLYDTLPGGAGFSSQLVDHGTELLETALDLMKTCPENCDSSCYRCLRSFKNKFEHSLLDRHVGVELLEYLISGQLPEFDAKRLLKSTKLLFNDLSRQSDDEMTYMEAADIQCGKGNTLKAPIFAIRKRDGAKFVVTLSGPLTDEHPADTLLLQLKEISGSPALIVINELLVRGNLPAASAEVRARFDL